MSPHYERGDYDPATKTLKLSIKSDTRDPKHRTKVWDVDPQQQTIDLLKRIELLMRELVDRTAPYHSGPQVVEVDKKGLLDALEGTKPPDPES